MDVETEVARHYAHSDLTGTVLAALRDAGRDLGALTTADLAPVDEFHLGWHPQTVDLAARLALPPGSRLLDIGSGIGGPARYFAEKHGCTVTGIDLTPAFVAAATELSARTGLADRTRFVEGSALDLPFEDGSFDAATLFHVGMNIADKARLFAEARRALRQGGTFAVYEVMRKGQGPCRSRSPGPTARRRASSRPPTPTAPSSPPPASAWPASATAPPSSSTSPRRCASASPPRDRRSSASTSSWDRPPPPAWAPSSAASNAASSPRLR